MLKQFFLVGLGGGLGSVVRFAISLLTAKYYTHSFPAATFVINIFGCFLIGLLIALASRNNIINQNIKLLLITGFCGGFTTFSTFASENISLMQTNNHLTSVVYIVASIVGGLCSVWVGISLLK